MKKRRLISTLLIGAMMVTMASGCGKKADTPDTKVDTKVEDTTNNDTEKGKDTTTPSDNSGKLTDEKVTFTLVATQQATQTDFNNMPFFKELEEKTNVHIEFQMYDAVTYGDQKNLMLSGGALPDGFFGYTSITMDDVNKYGPMGMFIPLDELIEANAPNYKARLTENELLNGLSTSFDGKKYAFGTVNESDARNYPDNLYINKTWLDKLNLEVPTTIDEYYEVLKAFKEKDPNGNGKADEIPYEFTKYNHISGYGSLFGAFGRVDVHNGSTVNAVDHIVVENGKVVFTADKPEYKEAIISLQKFFKDDLFDKEGLVQEQSQYQAKMMNPEGIVGSFYAWAAAGAVAPEVQEQYIAIAPLKGPSGQDAHVKYRRNHINVQGTGLVITTECKNPELLVKWIDRFYEEKQSMESMYGTVGTGLIENADGTLDYVKENGPDNASYIAMWGQYAPQDGAPKYITADMYGKVIPVREDDADKLLVINDFYKNVPNDLTLPTMNFNETELKVNTTIALDIGNLVKEKQSKWLLGEANIEKEWDSYVAQLEKLKLPELIASMQGAYDRTMN